MEITAVERAVVESGRRKVESLICYFSPIRPVILLLLTLSTFNFQLSTLPAATLLGRQSPFGDPVRTVTARQMAMGGAGLAVIDDASAALTNPAQLSSIKPNSFSFVGAPSAMSTYEKATHSDSNKTFDENASVSAEYPLAAAACSFRRWTLAVAWANVYDFHYFFDVSDYTQGGLASQKRAEDSGEMRVLAGAASVRFTKFRFGIAYLAYRGTPSFSYRDYVYNPISGALISANIRENRKVFGGRQFTGGASYIFDENLTLGALLKTRFNLSETETVVSPAQNSDNRREWFMPWELGVGAAYKFASKKTPATVALDLVKTWWGKTEVAENGGDTRVAGLVDTLSYHVGLEIYLKPNVPFRFGGSLVPFYGREEADTFTVAAGSGYVWEIGRRTISLDVSGEYQLRSTSGTTRLFAVPEDSSLPFINQDVVDSYVKRFMLTARYHF